MIHANVNMRLKRTFWGRLKHVIDPDAVNSLFKALKQRGIADCSVLYQELNNLMMVLFLANKTKSDYISVFVETTKDCKTYRITLTDRAAELASTKTDDFDKVLEQDNAEFDKKWGFKRRDEGFHRIYRVTAKGKEAYMDDEKLAEFSKEANFSYQTKESKGAELDYYMTKFGFTRERKEPTKEKDVYCLAGRSALLTTDEAAEMQWALDNISGSDFSPKMMVNTPVVLEDQGKSDVLLSCLKCLVMRDLIKDCPEKQSAIEIVKKYDHRA